MRPYMPMDTNSMIKNSIFFTDSSYFEKKKVFPFPQNLKSYILVKIKLPEFKGMENLH